MGTGTGQRSTPAQPGDRPRPDGWDRERDRGRNPDGVTVSAAKPLLRPAPRSAMFFPLVVLVAVLPGLFALNSWDLTPPGPWWGLRGLAVLDGYIIDQSPAAGLITPALESWTFRMLAKQPPLYAWLEAAALALSADNDPLASVLPSYIAGGLVVILVYLHGRLWRGPGVGLVAAVLTAFNRNLLVQIQQATPTTLALAGVLGALFCYGKHVRVTSESTVASPWEWEGPIFWSVLGGLSMGLSLMSVSLFGLVVIPVIVLHQAYLAACEPPAERSRIWTKRGGWLLGLFSSAGSWAALALGVAALVALPWHLWMYRLHGQSLITGLLSPLEVVGLGADRRPMLPMMVRLAPAVLPLGLYAVFRSVRFALADESNPRSIVGGIFWVLWLAVASLVPSFWRTGPWHLAELFLLVPLNLLAAQAISELASRRIPVRVLTWLAPATAVSVAWWYSTNLRNAIDDLFHARANPATALGLHLALDLVIVAVFLTMKLDRWVRRRDDRQRKVLAGFLLAVTIVTIAAGSREVRFRDRVTEDLLLLRTIVLRRARERPFTSVAVVGPESYRETTDGVLPGGRLRFILRTALPNLPQHDYANTDQLPNLPEGQQLVILAGGNSRFAAVQARLKLEAIHPGRTGVLDAFATVSEPEQTARPRR